MVEFEFSLNCFFNAELYLRVIDLVLPEVGDEAVDWFQRMGEEFRQSFGEGECVVEGEGHAVLDDSPEGEHAG